jgi:hypothetical protein
MENSVVESLPGMQQALGWITSTKKKKNKMWKTEKKKPLLVLTLTK